MLFYANCIICLLSILLSFNIKDNLVLTATTKDAVIMFIHYVLRSMDSRAVWIRSVLDSKVLVGKPLVYYSELGEPSHANALDYLINNWDEVISKVPLYLRYKFFDITHNC